jgi:O-antigen/teichoic acid export membrane protein
MMQQTTVQDAISSAAAADLVTVGDRLGGFAVLLPAAVDGPVVLAVRPLAAEVLRIRYPGAITYRRDGYSCPPADAALIVVDTACADVADLALLLRPGGTMAVLGADGDVVLYPDSAHPEHLWRRGWPIPHRQGMLAQLRRTLGLRVSRLRHAPRLDLQGPARPSLGDVVLADIAAQTGSPARLVGVHTAGATVLRVRQPDRDLAVHLAITPGAHWHTVVEAVAADVPAAGPLLPPVRATGRTLGCHWVATDWLPRRHRPANLVGGMRRRWRLAERLADTLASAPTGQLIPGWAHRWCAAVRLVPEGDRPAFVRVLRPLEGTPAGWCHGDPWAANMLVDGRRGMVIDWDNAAPDAPLGLDWLLIEMLRARLTGSGTVGAVCAEIVRGDRVPDHTIGGRPFGEWDAEHRAAFAVAAFLLYLRNRSRHDLGDDALRDEVDAVLSALAAERAAAEADGAPPASRAARGVMWLGLSAAVVKGTQTIVLLVVAALAPPAALGVLAVANIVINVSQAISDLGTSTGLIYRRGDPTRAARSALTLGLLVTFVLTAAVWIVAPQLSAALGAGDDGAWVIRGLASVLPCYGAAGVTLELLRRDLAFARRVLPDIVSSVVGAVVAVVIAFQGHPIGGVVIGQVCQGALALLLAWLAGRVVRPGWDLREVRFLLSYGSHLTGANLVQLALLNVDYVLVGRVLGGSPLGEYSLAFRLAYLPFVNVTMVIAGAAFPLLCRAGRSAFAATTERFVSVALMAVLPVCALLCVCADGIVVLGAKWQPAVPVVRFLAGYAALLSLLQLSQTTLNAAGRPQKSLQLRLLHLVCLVAVLAVLVRHGITAVAIGQVLAAAVAVLAALAMLRRHVAGLRLPALARRVAPTALALAGLAGATLAVRAATPALTGTLAGLVLLAVVGLAAYLGVLLLVGRSTLTSSLRMLRGRT